MFYTCLKALKDKKKKKDIFHCSGSNMPFTVDKNDFEIP